MDKDLSTVISLISSLISLGSFFGLFYKMKYQLEQMEKKQDKLLDSLDDVVETTHKNKEDIITLQVKQREMEKDIVELKGEKNGRRETYERTS